MLDWRWYGDDLQVVWRFWRCLFRCDAQVYGPVTPAAAQQPGASRGVSMRAVRLRPTLVILASAALGVVALAAPAGARPRGTNGQITYDRTDPATGDQAVFTANPDGSSERLVVPASCCGDFSPDGRRRWMSCVPWWWPGVAEGDIGRLPG